MIGRESESEREREWKKDRKYREYKVKPIAFILCLKGLLSGFRAKNKAKKKKTRNVPIKHVKKKKNRVKVYCTVQCVYTYTRKRVILFQKVMWL